MKQLPINDRHSNKGAIYFYLPLIFILMPSLPSVLPELLGFQIIFALEVMVVLSLYKNKECIEKNIPEAEAVERLIAFIDKDLTSHV